MSTTDIERLRVDTGGSFDRFARMIQDSLDVPVGLVTVVERHRQVFLGAIGLPEPVRAQRETPLSHSFCQYVVADDAPLVIADARIDRRLQANLAIEDLGVIAYAGYPLRDPQGRAIGSVCAIDLRPRDWTEKELRVLRDIADTAAAELALQESRAALRDSVVQATQMSRRASMLLSLSEALAEASTLPEVASVLRDVATHQLDCVNAGIWVITEEHGRDLHYVEHPERPWPQAGKYATLALDSGNPLGAALAAGRVLFFEDFAAQSAGFPLLDPGPDPADRGARAFMPLSIAGRPLGALAVLWPQARLLDNEDRVTLAGLASYAAQAINRAQLLAERAGVARTLQDALLIDRLPQPERLSLAGRYLAAAEHDEVGGDWYDCVILPSGATAITIGDVEGHDIKAAARMGGLRNMLRALVWAIDDAPSANVQRLDQAGRDLGLRTNATLVFGRIEAAAPGSTGPRAFLWTNAGHPPPLLVLADGTSSFHEDDRGADTMLGVLPNRPRRDHTVRLPVGSTLLLYTDGLVESREQEMDEGLQRLRAAAVLHRHLPVPDMIDRVVDDVVGVPVDDVAVLGVRVEAPVG